MGSNMATNMVSEPNFFPTMAPYKQTNREILLDTRGENPWESDGLCNAAVTQDSSSNLNYELESSEQGVVLAVRRGWH